MKIPEDYVEFLHWVKTQTETFWSREPNDLEEELTCPKWAYGAKWVGLSDNEIDSIEKEFNIKFTFYHREFLKVLHTLDRKEVIEYEPFDDDDEVTIVESSFFYDWRNDKEEIKRMLDWPRETILADILGSNQDWLKSWGVKPKSDQRKEEVFLEWLNKAPKLIPITCHHFVISDTLTTDNPVLSVMGTDTVMYGWNMKLYLMNLFGFQNFDICELIFASGEDGEFSNYDRTALNYLY